MSNRRVSFFNSPALGIRRYWEDDGQGGGTIVSTQDVEPILDRNKELANASDGYTPSRDMQLAASIPLIVWMKWMTEEGWNAFDPANQNKLKRKLNDPDFLYLRTAHGRL